jgi:hypothetical protein
MSCSAAEHPVPLTNAVLKRVGLTKRVKSYWMERLEEAGVIDWEQEPGKAARVTWNNPARKKPSV